MNYAVLTRVGVFVVGRVIVESSSFLVESHAAGPDISVVQQTSRRAEGQGRDDREEHGVESDAGCLQNTLKLR